MHNITPSLLPLAFIPILAIEILQEILGNIDHYRTDD